MVIGTGQDKTARHDYYGAKWMDGSRILFASTSSLSLFFFLSVPCSFLRRGEKDGDIF